MTMGVSVHNPYTDYSTEIKTDNTLHSWKFVKISEDILHTLQMLNN